VLVELDVAGLLGVADVVDAVVVAEAEDADGGIAAGAVLPQPAKPSARTARAVRCRCMDSL
jgi:hypothetical protein